ncbi:MAG: hypothetical protein M3032_11870 [Verrucomicrobiota bacterium]|nr:hypothetical protein [Verrucomicrobiota bacterium]
MKQTITESGGLYWLQHSPPKALLRTAIGAHRTVSEHVRDAFDSTKSLFGRMRSIAVAGEKSRLVIGSAAQCISPCLERMPRRARRLVVLAR